MSIVADFLDSCSPALERLAKTNPELAESGLRVIVACTQLESEMKPKQTITQTQKEQLERTCLLFSGSLVNPAETAKAENEDGLITEVELAKDRLNNAVSNAENDIDLGDLKLSPELTESLDNFDLDNLDDLDIDVEGIDIDDIDLDDIDLDDIEIG